MFVVFYCKVVCLVVRSVSDDKRADIIAAKQRKEPTAQIKKWFNISERAISRI
jgi:hypothetical protein